MGKVFIVIVLSLTGDPAGDPWLLTGHWLGDPCWPVDGVSLRNIVQKSDTRQENVTSEFPNSFTDPLIPIATNYLR